METKLTDAVWTTGVLLAHHDLLADMTTGPFTDYFNTPNKLARTVISKATTVHCVEFLKGRRR